MMNQNFGQPYYIEDTQQASIVDALKAVSSPQTKAILLLIADDNKAIPSYLNELLKNSPTPIFGGICPALICGDSVKEKGAIFVPVYADIQHYVIEDMASFSKGSATLSLDTKNLNSLFVFLDGLHNQIDKALTQLFQCVGQELSVVGGGLGSLSFERRPYVFSPQGCLQDAMIIIGLPNAWQISIAHGWEILDGPFLASEVADNVLIDLNYQPAIQGYAASIAKVDSRDFSDTDFFEIAQNYPFGLDRLDEDLLVRDPIILENGQITCVGKIPENSMLYILQGNPNKIIDATSQAVKKTMNNTKAKEGIIFDCISRQLYLKDRFEEELCGIAQSFEETQNLFGALVMGEVASSVSGGINLHNKTAVVGLFGKESTF